MDQETIKSINNYIKSWKESMIDEKYIKSWKKSMSNIDEKIKNA